MSIRNRFLKWILRRLARPIFEDGLDLQKFRKIGEFDPDQKFVHPCSFKETEIGGVPVYVVTPPNLRDSKLLVYFHGGALVCEAGKDLWKFALRLSRDLGRKMIFVRYRLAPEHPFPAAFDDVCKVLRELAASFPAQPIQLAGDSAGAGLALSAAMAMKGEVAIERMALLSPWSNLILDHPEIDKLDARDPLIAAAGLREAGRLYAGDADKSDWRLSPVKGPLHNLPPALIMAGSDDISVGDCRSLAQRSVQEGWDLTYHEEKDMIHNWIAFPLIPEAPRDHRIFIEYLLR